MRVYSLQAPAVTRGWHGAIGGLLLGVSWALNWLLPGPRTHVLFFPLWLGYILVVDALVLRRTGSSPLTRSPRDFAMLFVISVPVWWLFEVLNWRTGNWRYLGRELFSDLEYGFFASLGFSTVVPAVFVTAELVGSFGWLERFAHGPRVPVTSRVCAGLFLAGCAMLTLVLLSPYYFYPFVWIAIFCLVEPLNVWLAKRSILAHLQHGDWRSVTALCTGTLTCGFFWEMWNSLSYPKWVYHLPGVSFWHLFEMPLLGYLGYLPFGLELYAIAQLMQPGSFQLQIHGWEAPMPAD